MSMRTKLILLAAMLLPGVPNVGMAAEPAYPSRPITIVSGYPPGTPVDSVARIIAVKLGERMQQPVIVENRSGAGSSIGAAAVARAQPDGYTLFISSIANTVNPSLNKLSFDFVKDLAPISMVVNVPVVLVVPSSGPTTLAGLVAAAKSRPGELTFGSSGTGTATHLFAELFSIQTAVKFTHIPYKGSSETVRDLLAGRLDLTFSPAGTVIPHIKSGKLRALAISGQQRAAALPDVPTFSEAGVQGLDFSLWFGLNAPAGTPASIIAYLNKELGVVLDFPEVKSQLAAQAAYPAWSTSDSFGLFVRRDTDRWARVVKAAGIQQSN
jgi:tripartite-type tricarboxylate transporter receptor subunit TctC